MAIVPQYAPWANKPPKYPRDESRYLATLKATCPRCGEDMSGRVWHSFLGHLGLHGLADRYFDGDMQAAQKSLRNNGLARQDPAPWNGA